MLLAEVKSSENVKAITDGQYIAPVPLGAWLLLVIIGGIIATIAWSENKK